MKLLLCLAMSLGLSAILYFYMKQKISNIETRLNTLSDLMQTLTNEFCKKEVKTLSNIPLENSYNPTPFFVNNEAEGSDEEGSDEDCTDEESGTDEESESEPSLPKLISDDESLPRLDVDDELEEVQEHKIIELVKEVLPEPEEKIIIQKEKSLEINEPNVPLIKVSDDDVLGTKQITVSVDYSNLSLKDLKQKVSDLGGPALKTKSALLNFLKNKV
jgi:hypothetical protein